MQLFAQPGIQDNADNNQAPVRAGKQGEVMVSELHGRYYEQAYRQASFRAAQTTALTTTAGLLSSGVAFVGCGLYNPPSSGVNLVIRKHSFAYLVAFAAASALGLQVGFAGQVAPSAITSMSSIHNGLIKGSNNVLQYTGAAGPFAGLTIAASGFLDVILGAGLTGAITTTPGIPVSIDLEGSLVIAPGGFVATYTSTASGAASAVYSFDWEEVPIN
jgi:hypothetical protein